MCGNEWSVLVSCLGISMFICQSTLLLSYYLYITLLIGTLYVKSMQRIAQSVHLLCLVRSAKEVYPFPEILLVRSIFHSAISVPQHCVYEDWRSSTLALRPARRLRICSIGHK